MKTFVIDVGGNFIKSASVQEGEIIQQFESIKTPQTLAGFKQGLDDVFKHFMDDFQAIAISHAGIVDDSSGKVVFNGSLPFLKDFSYQDYLVRFNRPVNLIDDGQAAALAEARKGGLIGVNKGASLTIGTGVALGIIVNGQIYQGAHGVAGEVSFILPSYQAEPLVRQAGAFTFIRPANELLGNSDLEDARPVFKAIKEGNTRLDQMLTDYLKVIVNLIYNLHVILDIERLTIGGGISNEPMVLDRIRDLYQEVYTHHPSFVFKDEIFQPVEIQSCQFKSEANLIGAYYHQIDQLTC
ncbi:ROK family protein [Facklamia languida]